MSGLSLAREQIAFPRLVPVVGGSPRARGAQAPLTWWVTARPGAFCSVCNTTQ
jgi:hypothetical protein